MQFINAYLSSHSLVSNNELWQNFLFLWLPAQFPVFMMGIILFHLIYGKKEGLFTTKTQLNVLFFLFFFLTVELLYFDQLPAINGYAVAYALLIFVLASHPFKLFVNSFWIYLGKISYSAYLIHFAVIDFAVKLQSSLNLGFKLHIYQRYLVVLVLTVVITMIISSITYVLVEKPGIVLGKKIINYLEKKGKINFNFFNLFLKNKLKKVDTESW